MTYAEFLLVFLLIPLGVLMLLARGLFKGYHLKALGLVLLLAFLYTAPWDNYAAKHKLWTYAPRFVPASHYLGYLPIEEYAFYLLQALLVCTVLLLLTRYIGLLNPDKDGRRSG